MPAHDRPRKLADLPIERDGQAREFFGSPTLIGRALVHDEQIPVTSRITPYEDAREIIRRMPGWQNAVRGLGLGPRTNASVERTWTT